MRLVQLETKQARVLQLRSSAEVLFSYETPVAALIDGVVYRVDRAPSITTARHIGAFGRRHYTTSEIIRVNPVFFDSLLAATIPNNI